MSSNITWRVYCLTEGDWTSGTLLDSAGTPTVCFNDPGHTINQSSAQVLSTSSIQDSTSTTTGALTSQGGLGVAKSVFIGGQTVIEGRNTGDPADVPQLTAKAITVTDTTTAASGTLATFYFNKFEQSTLNASNSSVTTTDASTVYIEGPPIEGTNQTITNKCALLVDGDVQVNGSINVSTINVNIKTARIRDEKVIGTNGGNFVSGAWRVRELNTITTDAGSGISLASDQITLTAGTYIVEGEAPAYDVNSHTARFYNVTDATPEILGTVSRGTNTNFHTVSTFKEKITLTSTKVFELQHRCNQTRNNDGLGYATGYQTEIYANIFIMKLTDS